MSISYDGNLHTTNACVCMSPYKSRYVYVGVYVCYVGVRMFVWVYLYDNIEKMDANWKLHFGQRRFIFISFVGHYFLALTSRGKTLASFKYQH